MGLIAVTKKDRVIGTITGGSTNYLSAFTHFDEQVKKLLKEDPDARPLFPPQVIHTGFTFVFQQWSYIKTTESGLGVETAK